MSKLNSVGPPKWADRFLEWYCSSQLLEEIQGDAYELFYLREKELGLKKARMRYVWDVIRFFRLSNIKKSKTYYKSLNNITMLRNYLKIGIRSILKNRVPSSINIFGLSLSIACTIVVFIFTDFQNNMDSYHENADDIYQVTNWIEKNDDVDQWGYTPAPLAQSLRIDFDQVLATARVNEESAVVKYKDEVLNEVVSFADPSFLQMFSFPLQAGNRNALTHEKGIVISNNVAIKYFGYDDPIGKELEIIFEKDIKESFIVMAIADRLPANSSFGFEVLIPFDAQRIIYGMDMNSWAKFIDVTFVQMKPGATPNDLLNVMDNKYVKLQNEVSEWKIDHFSFVGLPELSLNDYAISYSYSSGGHPGGRVALTVVVVFLLLLSCLNYMNIAIVSASGRLKEIGLRKVIGGTRSEIIRQFIVENIMVCFISLLFGIVLAYYVLLPGFNSALPFIVPFAFSSPWVMAGFFILLVLVVGIVSGSYPAFYISAFKPVEIFSGKQKFGKKNLFSKIFLIFQFALAFTTIVAGIIFTENSIYQANLDWGYNPKNIISIPIEADKHYTALYAKFNAKPEIINVAGSQHHIGRSNISKLVEHENNKFEAQILNIGPNYFETMNLRLVEGKPFTRMESSNDMEAIIINQSFDQDMNWDNPIDQKITIDEKQYYVIGVVENFRFWSFHDAIAPCILRIADKASFNYIAIQSNAVSSEVMNQYMKTTWKEVEPDLPYEGFDQDQVFARFFAESKANTQLMFFVSAMALVLACMGLYGLVSFNITRKMKDFSIRRVLGANLWSITKIVNSDFIWQLIIAGIIGAPAAYYLMNLLLNSVFEVVKPTTAVPFIIAIAGVILTAYITIASQIVKVAKTNPTETLKSE